MDVPLENLPLEACSEILFVIAPPWQITEPNKVFEKVCENPRKCWQLCAAPNPRTRRTFNQGSDDHTVCVHDAGAVSG